MDKAVKTYIAVLKAEIQHLKSQLQPHDTGHIHTTIGMLSSRIDDIKDCLAFENYKKDTENDPYKDTVLEGKD